MPSSVAIWEGSKIQLLQHCSPVVPVKADSVYFSKTTGDGTNLLEFKLSPVALQ